MELRYLAASLALAAGASLASAEIVLLTFDDLAAGTNVSTQYAPRGVVFSTLPTLDRNGVPRSFIEVVTYDGGPLNAHAVTVATSPITLAFDSDISNFAVTMSDTDRGTLLGRIRAFNAQGNLMGHMTDMTGPYNTGSFYQNTLFVNVSGIRYVEITSDADGAFIDNITFARIPAPGATALLPLGLLALARRRRI